MPTRIEELKSMAAECRRMAAMSASEPVRGQLLVIAEHFDRLAQHWPFPVSAALSGNGEPLTD